MPSGILVVNKPPDWTSMDVCAKLRGVFHEKRIGHAGTLDPMATGVLPVFVGRATRAVQYAETGEKEYIAGLLLGLVTNTQDTSGEILETHPVPVTGDDLNAVLESFRGEIDQIPPMYSAVKINGKKLYELARKGVEVERKARKVTIHTLELTEDLSPTQTPLPINADQPAPHFYLRIRCSKGTYIRTLCHDIGRALGCGGCMSALIRSSACGFPLTESHPLEEVLSHPDPTGLLLSVDKLFSDRPALSLKEAGEKKLRNGAALSTPRLSPGQYRVYGPEGEFLALCQCAGGRLSTIKSFFEV